MTVLKSFFSSCWSRALLLENSPPDCPTFRCFHQRFLSSPHYLVVCINTRSTELMSRPHVVVVTPGRLSPVIANSSDIKNCYNKTQFQMKSQEVSTMIDSQFDDLAIILDVIPENMHDFYFTTTSTGSLRRDYNFGEKMRNIRDQTKRSKRVRFNLNILLTIGTMSRLSS
ncbi:hypothetical protein GEMRC1_010274 [Eukaryota sp. GEM-RC1]